MLSTQMMWLFFFESMFQMLLTFTVPTVALCPFQLKDVSGEQNVRHSSLFSFWLLTVFRVMVYTVANIRDPSHLLIRKANGSLIKRRRLWAGP